MRTGLQSVAWEGRPELIDEDPSALLDGAPNPAAAVVLGRYLQEFLLRHPEAHIILVWGMMRDKDHREFIAPLLPSISEMVLISSGS